MAFRSVGMGYVGAGGQRFQSSALARGSLGHTTTRPNTPAETAKWYADRGLTPPGAQTSPSVKKDVQTGPSVSKEARAAIQAAMARYEEGGGYGKGVEAGLERGRVKAISSGMQNLVSSGLAGTTIAGGLGKKYEQEVAQPARAQVEETRASALSGLQLMLAQMEQGGYQADLGRSFQASESALSRGFQEDQHALNRFSRNIPVTPYQPQQQPQRQQLQQSLGIAKPATKTRIPMSFAAANVGPSTGPRTPGSYVGSINGQRWVYNQQGVPTRE